jgi:uncharacterized membrane protein (UPF0127 family)
MPLFFNRSGAIAPMVILSLAIPFGGCNRAPSEPHPDPLPTTASATTTVATTTVGGRCIVPLAQTAPAVPPAAGNQCPADPQGRFKLTRARVSIPDANASVDAELARSMAEGERGLMYRKAMGEDEGMLFYIDEKRIQTFWMHNTCIPLDMLFIDDDGTIVGIVESAPVLDDGARQVDCPSRYVLEVNAGWTRRHGVKPGQRLVLPP